MRLLTIRDKGYVATTTKDIARLADLLGHSSMDTTRIYTMSSGREFKRYFDQMDLVFSNRKNN